MESDQSNGNRGRVSHDTIYAQMSDMALRHRNYEKEIAAWYTAILSAIFGLVLSSRFQASISGIARPLSENRFVQMILDLVVLTIALSSSYSIWFFHVQHTRIDRYIDTLLDPADVERKAAWLRELPKLKPSRLMIAVQLLIALGIIGLIFLEP